MRTLSVAFEKFHIRAKRPVSYPAFLTPFIHTSIKPMSLQETNCFRQSACDFLRLRILDIGIVEINADPDHRKQNGSA
ncbi:hypothetical protein B0G62_104143 [Paraburkholderia eburnea]|uniref:Uncharacterized protein n=1 Tax=Paraburkholderia eburnea TaxID=1189126 RepID=A0A2S4MDL9_9BURK|nr:hypothetical protein B0G62_104143 [Paraburkholderia eburnea]